MNQGDDIPSLMKNATGTGKSTKKYFFRVRVAKMPGLPFAKWEFELRSTSYELRSVEVRRTSCALIRPRFQRGEFFTSYLPLRPSYLYKPCFAEVFDYACSFMKTIFT